MIVNSWTRSEYYRIKAALHGKVPTRMELFRMMKEPQYLSCIEKSKENIFRQYLAALEEMGELSAEDEELKMSRLQKTGLLKRSPVFMLKFLQAQPFYPIPFLNRIQPFLRHGFIMIIQPCQTACDCGGGIGIIAEVDCAEQAAPKAIGMKQAPDCRLQSMQDVAITLDFIFGQGEKFIEVAQSPEVHQLRKAFRRVIKCKALF